MNGQRHKDNVDRRSQSREADIPLTQPTPTGCGALPMDLTIESLRTAQYAKRPAILNFWQQVLDRAPALSVRLIRIGASSQMAFGPSPNTIPTLASQRPMSK